MPLGERVAITPQSTLAEYKGVPARTSTPMKIANWWRLLQLQLQFQEHEFSNYKLVLVPAMHDFYLKEFLRSRTGCAEKAFLHEVWQNRYPLTIIALP